MFLRYTALYWSSIKKDSEMKRLHCLCEKKKKLFLSLFGNIRVEHHCPLINLFWDSVQVIIDFLSGNLNAIYSWKNRLSSAKCFTFDIKLLGRSFMHIKNSNGPKIDPCGTSALIGSQWKFWPLSKSLWYFFPENFKKVLVSYHKQPLSSIYISNLHTKPYQKLLTYPKIRTAFPKTDGYQKICKFCAYRPKLIDRWISPWTRIDRNRTTVFFGNFIEWIKY